MAQVQIYPGAEADDYYWGAESDFSSTGEFLVGDSGGAYSDYSFGIRFPNTTIPKDAIIESAHISLVSAYDDSNPCGVNIYFNNVDDAAAPTTFAGAEALVLTSAVPWTIPPLALDESIDTPELKTIVQQIVNRTGWVSGNDMQVVVKTASGTGQRFFDNYGAGATKAELHITYFVGTVLNFGSAPVGLTLSMAGDLFAPGGLNQVLPALEGTGAIGVRSAFVVETLPALEILAAGRIGNVAHLFQVLPGYDLTAFGGAALRAFLPALELSGRILTGVSGSLNQPLPVFDLSAGGFAAQAGSLIAVLPGLEISAHACGTVIGTLSGTLPLIALRASGLSGAVGSSDLILPALTAEAAGVPHVIGNLIQILPALEINAHGRVIPAVLAYKVLVLNPKSLAMSEYAGFDFNSFAFFNGKYLGAKPTGIHVLEGDRDNGKNIDAVLSLGQVPIGGGKPRDVWVMGRSKGPMIVTMSEDEDPAEEGRIEYLIPSLGQDRAKVPRGMDPSYFQVGLKNAQGCAFDLDSIQVFGEPVKRRKA